MQLNLHIDSLHKLDYGGRKSDEGCRVLSQIRTRGHEIDEPASRQGNVVR